MIAEGRPEERSDASPRDPTGFATHVEHRRDRTSSAADLARSAPGVTVRDFGLNQSATVSVRGSTSDQVVVLLDGLPLNSAAGGGTDLSLLPSAFIERITVARGGGGARYGSGAMGGALEIETVDLARASGLFGSISCGSFGTAEASLGGAHRFGDVTAMLFTFARSSDGDFPFLYDDRPQLAGNPLRLRLRENNDARRVGALLKIGWESGPSRADLMVETDGGERGLPGPSQSPSLTTRQQDARLASVARYSRLIGPGELELRAGGRIGSLGLTFGGPELPGQTDTRGFAEAAWRMLLGRHALEIGLNAGTERLSSAFHGAHDRTLLALFASDEWALPWLTLLPAVRVEKVGGYIALSPKLGVSVPLVDALAAKANVGRGFRAPSFGELYLEQGLISPNPNLAPETSNFVDAGLVWRSKGLFASAAGFFTLYENLILYELFAPLRAKPLNFGRAWVYGAELEAVAARGPFELTAGYTYAVSENLLDIPRYLGKSLPYHPRHRFNARLSAIWGRLSGFVATDAQSELFLNRTNTDALPGRARFDVGTTVVIDKSAGVSATAEVKNVFNALDEDFYGYPLPGRAFFVTLRAGFSRDDSPSPPQEP